MIIERASLEDAGEILELQKLAYVSEAEIYEDYSIPPLIQTSEEIQKDFEAQVFLKASIDARIIGSVRACMKGATCHIGRLIVHPDFRNRGIGERLMTEVEGFFARAERYELFTGRLSERNLRLYRRLGYKTFASKSLSKRLTLVFLEKYPLSCEK